MKKQKQLQEQIIKKNKVKSWIIFFAILILVFTAIYATLNYVPFFANKRTLVIISDSMEPTINRGDLAVVNTNFELESLEEDMIIAFYRDLNNDGKKEILVHYIAKINNENDELTFKTKRENVVSYIDWDAWETIPEDIIGIYMFHIPNIGIPALFLDSIFGKIVIFIDILVVLWVVSVFTKDSKKKK